MLTTKIKIPFPFLTLSPAGLLLSLYLAASPPPANAQAPLAPEALPESSDVENGDQLHNTLVLVISALLVIQTLLIVGLQLSRVNHKRTKKELKRSQKALEQRVIDRTNKLRAINSQLYEEIAKHEITEELLRETQDYLNSMLNSMPSILIGVTRQGFITHWNSAAARSTGIAAPHALGKNLDDVCPQLAINIETIHEAIDTGTPQINENIQHNTDGARQYTDLTVYPLLTSEVAGAVIRIDDVTMRVKIENLLIQNEKMMSLGELAAGMAHEINNPLSAILHGVQNIYRRTSEELDKNHRVAAELNINVDQVRRYMEEREIFKFIDGIREAGERSAKIVTNMLEFSRSSSRRHTPVDIVELLEHSLELSANMFDLKAPEGIAALQIRKEFATDIPPVPCAAVEIQQVILNLLRNASQSFTGGHHSLTENHGSQNPVLQNPGSQSPLITLRARREEDRVRIEVEDNGQGMIEAVKRHIFEPFFTTKEIGQGTGLGLSVSYFIITEHHAGAIEVDSSPGKGTRFTIKLPLQHQADVGARLQPARGDDRLQQAHRR